LLGYCQIVARVFWFVSRVFWWLLGCCLVVVRVFWMVYWRFTSHDVSSARKIFYLLNMFLAPVSGT